MNPLDKRSKRGKKKFGFDVVFTGNTSKKKSYRLLQRLSIACGSALNHLEHGLAGRRPTTKEKSIHANLQSLKEEELT